MELLVDVLFVGASLAFFTLTGILMWSERGVRGGAARLSGPTARRLSWAAFAAIMVPFLIMLGLMLRVLRG